MHIGSQITDLAPFDDAFALLADFVRSAARRRPRDRSCRSRRRPRHSLSLRQRAAAASRRLRRNRRAPHARAWIASCIFEPGRLIVGNAGVLVTSVIYVKHGDGKTFRHRRRGDERSHPPDALRRASRNPAACAEPAPRRGACAPTSSARSARAAIISRSTAICRASRAGDLLAVMSAGAYGAVQAGTYNSRLLVPEVLVKGERICGGAAAPDLRGVDRPGQNSALVGVRLGLQRAAIASGARSVNVKADSAPTARPEPGFGAQRRSHRRSPLRRRALRESKLDWPRRAGLALLWERVWPPLAWRWRVVALFLAVSWFGLWLDLPAGAPHRRPRAVRARPARAALSPLARLRAPRRAQALARLDRDAPAPHRPASSSLDRLANPSDDRRDARALGAASAPPGREARRRSRSRRRRPRMVERDRRAALRRRVAGGLRRLRRGLGAIRARRRRVRLAQRGGDRQGFRLDAWIDPPAYTGKPPILLDAPDAQTTPQKDRHAGRLDPRAARARRHSRRGGRGALEPLVAAKSAAKRAAESRPRDRRRERRWTIKGDGKLRVSARRRAARDFEITGIAERQADDRA